MSTATVGPDLEHIAISVGDLDAQVAWYCEAFGFTADASDRIDVPEPKHRIALVRGINGFYIELVEIAGAKPRPRLDDPVEALFQQGYHHWTMVVEDIDAAIARLVSLGARQIGKQWDFPSRGVSVSMISDPEGNLIEMKARYTPTDQ